MKMPRNSVSIEINASCDRVFDLLHDYDLRLKWDSLLQEAKILGGVTEVGKGVRTRCVGTWKSAWTPMETEYVNFERAQVAAVRLINRPPFFSKFGATIQHKAIAENRSRVTYIYSFEARPFFLAFVLEPIMNAVLQRETKRRLEALRTYLEA